MNEYSTPIVDELLEGSFENPLYGREAIFMEGKEMIAGVVLMQVPHDVIPNRVHIAELRAIAKGGGRKVMDLITKRADGLGITLDLMPVPQRKGYYLKPLTLRKLVAWYRGFGFELQGRMTDGYMIRYPKQGMADNPVYPKRRGTPLKIGDKVRVMKGSVKGWNGIVIRIPQMADEDQGKLEVGFPNGFEVWIPKEDLRAVFDENPIYDKRRRAFNVGDCVRSKDYPELVGDVRSISSSHYDETEVKYTVAIPKETGVFLYEYFEEEIERAKTPC
jgi:hypothetical protein